MPTFAIAHRVVDAHEGDIAVAPRPGGGSMFEIHIPVLDAGKKPVFHDGSEAE